MKNYVTISDSSGGFKTLFLTMKINLKVQICLLAYITHN